MYLLLELLLAPLLLLQGKAVRRNTPRLPEPEGERSGQDGAGDTLRLLITGDSAAAGVGVKSQSDALSGQLVARLAGHYAVQWSLVATTGHSTGACIRELEHIPAQSFDVIVVSLGVNDVTARRSLAYFRARQQQLLQLLREKFGARHIVLSAVPPMHQFPALPQPLRFVMGLRARALDTVLRELATENPDCSYIEFTAADAGHLMAADGFHPGPDIYREWATLVADQVLDVKAGLEAKAG